MSSAETWRDSYGERGLLLGLAAILVLLTALSALFVDARITAAIAAVVFLGVLTFRQPYVGLLGYTAVLYGRPEELIRLPVALHIERIVALSLLAALALRWLSGRSHRMPANSLNWVMLAMLGTIWASVPFAYWKLRSAQMGIEFAKICFLYFAIIYLVHTVNRARGVIWVAMLAWAWNGASAWHGYATGAHVGMGEAGVLRAVGPTSRFGGPDDLANLLVVAIAFIVVLLWAERSWATRLLLALLALSCLGGMILTGSRTAFAALGFVCLVALWTSPRKLVTAVVVAASLAVAWRATPGSLQSRYRTMRTYQTEATYQTRRQGWATGARMFLEHPVLGVGAGNFGSARHGMYEPSWMEAHSVYWQVAAELGIPGIICFALLVVHCFRQNRRLRRQLREYAPTPDWQYADRLLVAVQAALATLLVVGIAGHNLYNPNYYLVAGLTVALGRVIGDAAGAEEAAH